MPTGTVKKRIFSHNDEDQFSYRKISGVAVWPSHYPWLYSFAKEENISVVKIHSTEHIHSLFYVPLSMEAFDQLNLLQQQLASI